jgi:uncharacterized protein RhaS with RHS repeats
MTEDPAGFMGGLNAFTYVLNSPVSWMDPYGLAALPTDSTLLDPEFRKCVCEMWKASGQGMRPGEERSAWILPNAPCTRWKWSGSPGSKETWNRRTEGPRPDKTSAVAHTHPRERTRGTPMDPKPSNPDHNTADNEGLPVYACSASGIWRADPNCTDNGKRCGPVKVSGPDWLDWCN